MKKNKRFFVYTAKRIEMDLDGDEEEEKIL